MNRFFEHYQNILRKYLLNKYIYTNPHELPCIKQISLNICSKRVIESKQFIIPMLISLELITGQQASIRRAKKSISSFKLHKGTILGCKVNLHGSRMYEFLDRLITIILPRLRELPVISITNFDGFGNFSFSLCEISSFPEIEQEFDKFDSLLGVNITINTTTHNNREGLVLLSGFLLPFKEH